MQNDLYSAYLAQSDMRQHHEWTHYRERLCISAIRCKLSSTHVVEPCTLRPCPRVSSLATARPANTPSSTPAPRPCTPPCTWGSTAARSAPPPAHTSWPPPSRCRSCPWRTTRRCRPCRRGSRVSTRSSRTRRTPRCTWRRRKSRHRRSPRGARLGRRHRHRPSRRHCSSQGSSHPGRSCRASRHLRAHEVEITNVSYCQVRLLINVL